MNRKRGGARGVVLGELDEEALAELDDAGLATRLEAASLSLVERIVAPGDARAWSLLFAGWSIYARLHARRLASTDADDAIARISEDAMGVASLAAVRAFAIRWAHSVSNVIPSVSADSTPVSTPVTSEGNGIIEAAAAVEGVCRAAGTDGSRPGTCAGVAVLDAMMALMDQMLSVSPLASQCVLDAMMALMDQMLSVSPFASQMLSMSPLASQEDMDAMLTAVKSAHATLLLVAELAITHGIEGAPHPANGSTTQNGSNAQNGSNTSGAAAGAGANEGGAAGSPGWWDAHLDACLVST
ncbi:hypothetical protein T484DRAFT_1842387, partial [Baffinella frigidus]